MHSTPIRSGIQPSGKRRAIEHSRAGTVGIDVDDFSVLALEFVAGVGCEDGETADLYGAVASEAVVVELGGVVACFVVGDVLEEGGGPGVGPHAGEGSVKIVEYSIIRQLIKNPKRRMRIKSQISSLIRPRP